MGSVPPVFLCFLEPVLQAEYQRFMPDFTTKFQNKKRAAFRLYFYVFWNRFCRQSTNAYQISYIFLVSFGTKNKKQQNASHDCAEIPAGIPAGIPQLTGRWQKKKVLCPAVPAPKGTVAVSDRRSFRYIYAYIYAYTYIYIYMRIYIYTHIYINIYRARGSHQFVYFQAPTASR